MSCWGQGHLLLREKFHWGEGAASESQKSLGFKRIKFIVFSSTRVPAGPSQALRLLPQLLVRVGLMLWQEDEVGGYGSQQHLTVRRASWGTVRPGPTTPHGLQGPGAPAPRAEAPRAPDADPVGRHLAGHERLQVVSAQVAGRPLIDPLREPLQQPHGHVPAGTRAGAGWAGVPTHPARTSPARACTGRTATRGGSGASSPRPACPSPSAPGRSA